jgi:enamine deaminase RidA (YjgF/YER057c/UK114 family)
MESLGCSIPMKRLVNLISSEFAGGESAPGDVRRMHDANVNLIATPEPREKSAAPSRPAAHKILQPAGWPRPIGYSNGILAEGTMVVTGGVVGWDTERRFPSGFTAQARQVFQNIAAILAEAEAGPQHLVRLTWYVLDIDEYRACAKELGAAYREIFGRNFPAMATVQVMRLVEPEARLEIEATAVVPRSGT